MSKPLSTGLHADLRKLAQRRPVQLKELKPNTREIANRMIASGELVKTERGFVWHEHRSDHCR